MTDIKSWLTSRIYLFQGFQGAYRHTLPGHWARQRGQETRFPASWSASYLSPPRKPRAQCSLIECTQREISTGHRQRCGSYLFLLGLRLLERFDSGSGACFGYSLYGTVPVYTTFNWKRQDNFMIFGKKLITHSEERSSMILNIFTNYDFNIFV